MVFIFIFFEQLYCLPFPNIRINKCIYKHYFKRFYDYLNIICYLMFNIYPKSSMIWYHLLKLFLNFLHSNDAATAKRKPTRERARKPETWKSPKAKTLTAQRRAHVNWTKKLIPEKSLKTTKDCSKSCRLECFSKISHDARQKIFDTYYSLSSEQQRFYILNTTACNPKQSSTSNKRSSQYSFFWRWKQWAGKSVQWILFGHTFCIPEKDI